MKLEIKKEWCLAAARREGDAEVGAGRIAFDPAPEVEGVANVQSPPVEAMQLAFGKLINFLRRKRSLTIEQLARQADVEAAELLLIEREPHYRAEPRTVYELARVLEVNVKGLQQLSGLVTIRSHDVVDEAVRFAASSDSIERLTTEQTRAVEQFVAALNRLADAQKTPT